MPAIWLFPRAGSPPDADQVRHFAEEEVGISECAVNPPDSGEDDAYVFTLEGEDGRTCTARVDWIPRDERSEHVQDLLDEIVQQEEDMAGELNDNAYDVVVSFEKDPNDMFAGMIAAYAIGSLGDCGILIPDIGTLSELALELADDEDAGNESPAAHQCEEGCTHTVFYRTAEEFASDFFEDHEGEDEEDEDGGSPGEY